MKRYVLGFYHSIKGVILIQKTTPEWQRGKWNGLGGHIEPGETPLQAMVREFTEEAGFATLPQQWTELFTIKGLTAENEWWEMTVFSTWGRIHQMGELPRAVDEGWVETHHDLPEPMDSTAHWIVLMLRDFEKHNMNFAYSHSQASTEADAQENTPSLT
jgi:8-oxo-dGTP pyrophosphatase MutT (NUDIX family)